MIALLLALALQSTQPGAVPADPETATVETPAGPLTTVTTETRLDIPDEIAPAILPYFACRAASRGVAMRSDGRELAPVAAKGADCSPARAKAAKDANAMLKRQGETSADARRKMIDATLASVDAVLPPVEAGKAAE